VGVGLLLGATLDAMRPGLEGFGGVERRFQRLGAAGGVDVVDDYAHHPTEVDATLAAARGAFPGRRLVAAFQPHLYSRTRDFAGAFGRALAAADAVFLAEVYPAREQPIAGVHAGLVADATAEAGRTVVWRGARDGLAEALAGFVAPGDVVLTIGAGDVTRTGPELLERLGGVRPGRRGGGRVTAAARPEAPRAATGGPGASPRARPGAAARRCSARRRPRRARGRASGARVFA
jgi:UDP-N-acetylmuramate--alanine ligase